MYKRPLIAFGLLILVIIGGVLIFNIPWGGTSDNTISNVISERRLVDYADTNAKARMQISGEIQYKGEHRTVDISVGRDSIVARILSGYDGDTLKVQRFSNTEEAYLAFLAALKSADFTNTQTTLNDNFLGSCPRGQRYYFTLADSVETFHESWTTSCSRRDGTFAGDRPTVEHLFKRQIPDYSKFSEGVSL